MVEPAQKRPHPVRRGADIGAGPSGRRDELADAHAGGGIFDGRAKSCGMGGAGGHHLTRAVDMVEGVVAAKAHHMGARRIRHLPALIGQPAMQRLGGDLALPAGQGTDALRDHVAPSNPSFSRAERAAADKSRSAMIAMKAIARPATSPLPGLALVRAI